MTSSELTRLRELIRDVPDFPEKGILFKDITTVLKDADALRQVIDLMTEPWQEGGIDLVVGIESRGFMFGVPIALNLGAGFIPVRKFGKLPAETIHQEYALEYGTNTLEIHTDAVMAGQRVVIVDDLLATGGTVDATIGLVERLGGRVAGMSFLIELDFLNGRDRFPGRRIESILHF